MSMQGKKTGFVSEPILEGKDYVFGGYTKLSGVKLQNDGQWDNYLPSKEKQKKTHFDTMSCVSFGTLNCIEILERRIFDKEKNYSDRFLAVISDTSRNGNTPQRVSEALRNSGVVEENVYPWDAVTSWREFMKEVPNRIKKRAKRFLDIYIVQHEYVHSDPEEMKRALQYSPLGVSVNAWHKDENGYYYKPKNSKDGHWTVIYGYVDGEYWKCFDSYFSGGTVKKKIRWDTDFERVKKYELRSRNNERIKSKVLQTLSKYNLLSFFFEWLNLFNKSQREKENTMSHREKVLDATKRWLGKDARPLKLAPQDLGCAEALCTVVQSVNSEFPKNITYTPYLKEHLDKDPRYKQTLVYKPGCIIISPTTESFTGHVGIITENEVIHSNNSETGLWDDYYTLNTWIERYRNKGGLSIYFYEPI